MTVLIIIMRMLMMNKMEVEWEKEEVLCVCFLLKINYQNLKKVDMLLSGFVDIVCCVCNVVLMYCCADVLSSGCVDLVC